MVLQLGINSGTGVPIGLPTCDTLHVSQQPLLTARAWNENSDTASSLVQSWNVSVLRSKEMECEPGHYCLQGLRYRCPAGRYGALRRETNPTCQGSCAEGYYCQWSSISPYANPCGSAEKICIEGSSVRE